MPESSSKDAARNDSGEIATSTLAEIYAQQGLIGRALSIYRRMLARAPEDAGIADRIRSLEVRMAEAGPEPQTERAPDPSAGRERLPWDPPEIEAAPAVEAPASPEAALSPVQAAPVEQAAIPPAEPEGAPVEAPRRVARIDREAFRSWLDGR
jgi:hypothetical protein